MSDWKESAVRRRDARQTKLPDIRSPGTSKKNTKKWCRGKVGVEHTPVCVSYDRWENRQDGTDWSKQWKLLVCSDCEKQLDMWWPSPWGRCAKLPPDWVVA